VCDGTGSSAVIGGKLRGHEREPTAAADTLAAVGAEVHLARPLGVKVLGLELDFAEVGFAFLGVGGDGVDGGVRGGGVQDQGDDLAIGVVAGQGDDPGPPVSCSGCRVRRPVL
jgi:hypothetical protein